MEQFQKRLKEAEEAAFSQRRDERDMRRKGEGDRRRQGWRRETDQDRESDRERHKERQKDMGRDRWPEGDRGRDRDRDRGREKDLERQKDMTRDRRTETERGRFFKPSDSDDFLPLGAGYRRPGLTASSSSQSTGKFLKPGDDDDDVVPAWRKRDEKKVGVNEKEESGAPKREEESRTVPVQKSR